MNMNTGFYTYAHYRKSDNLCFYIGKGQKRRAYERNSDRRSEHWLRTAEKHGCDVEILAHWKTEDEAFEHEKILISAFRKMGHPLVNLKDGGEGGAGFKMGEAQLERHAKRVEEQWAHPDAPIRVATTSDEFREKMAVVNKEIGLRPEQRAFRSEVAKRNWTEGREKIKAAHAAVVCKKVVCVETGVVHDSLHLAAMWLRKNGRAKAHGNHVGACARGKAKTAYGFTWKFLDKELK